MKTLIILMFPVAALANPSVPWISPQSTVNNSTTNSVSTNPTANGGNANSSAIGVGGSSQAVGSGTATTGPVNAGVNIEASRLATAPDVISYPTAPCRVSIGASGGWFGGALGFSSSVQDETCALIEKSRHLHNQGHKAAATQLMCLDEQSKQALEATGVKCLISGPVAGEQVKP